MGVQEAGPACSYRALSGAQYGCCIRIPHGTWHTAEWSEVSMIRRINPNGLEMMLHAVGANNEEHSEEERWEAGAWTQALRERV